MEYTNEADSASLFNEGEVPLLPERLTIRKQTLIESGIADDYDGTCDYTTISVPAGARTLI